MSETTTPAGYRITGGQYPDRQEARHIVRESDGLELDYGGRWVEGWLAWEFRRESMERLSVTLRAEAAETERDRLKAIVLQIRPWRRFETKFPEVMK